MVSTLPVPPFLFATNENKMCKQKFVESRQQIGLYIFNAMEWKDSLVVMRSRPHMEKSEAKKLRLVDETQI